MHVVGGISKALVVLACVAYPWLLHSFITGGKASAASWLLVLMPFVALAWWIAARAAHKLRWLAVLLAAGAGVYFMFAGHYEWAGLAAAGGLSHAGFNLLLCWLFGRTLLPGKEPLITRVARRVHGKLEPRIEIYTRRVTAAWSVFFAAQIVISILLYSFASIAVWSLFINVLNLPTLILMFAGEYACRIIFYPDHPRASILKVIQIYTQDAIASRKADLH